MLPFRPISGLGKSVRRGADAVARRLSPVRFGRDRRGVAAIEFALIGPLHIALLLSMMETGLILAKVSLLDVGVSQASKEIYIGAAQSSADEDASADALEAIRESVCEYVDRLQDDCLDNLIVEVTEVSDFGDIPATDVTCQEASADVDLQPTVEFNTGSTSSVVYLRICLTTDVIFPGLGAGLAMTKTPTGKFQIVSATAFMNEPF